jgi:hypothetical protein
MLRAVYIISYSGIASLCRFDKVFCGNTTLATEEKAAIPDLAYIEKSPQ